MVDRLELGKPRTYSQALTRLPSIKDLEILQNDELLVLAFLKDNLESVNHRKVPLEDRFTELTPNELKLLEETDFRRGEELFSARWTGPDVESRWAYFYGITKKNFEDKYANWRITQIIPDFPDQNRYQMVCIQTNPDFEVETPAYNENSRFAIGLVTEKELLDLKETLHRI